MVDPDGISCETSAFYVRHFNDEFDCWPVADLDSSNSWLRWELGWSRIAWGCSIAVKPMEFAADRYARWGLMS